MISSTQKFTYTRRKTLLLLNKMNKELVDFIREPHCIRESEKEDAVAALSILFSAGEDKKRDLLGFVWAPLEKLEIKRQTLLIPLFSRLSDRGWGGRTFGTLGGILNHNVSRRRHKVSVRHVQQCMEWNRENTTYIC